MMSCNNNCNSNCNNNGNWRRRERRSAVLLWSRGVPFFLCRKADDEKGGTALDETQAHAGTGTKKQVCMRFLSSGAASFVFWKRAVDRETGRRLPKKCEGHSLLWAALTNASGKGYTWEKTAACSKCAAAIQGGRGRLRCVFSSVQIPFCRLSTA